MVDVYQPYLTWLEERVGYFNQDKEYDLLMSFLIQHRFYWKIAMDENRAADGVRLRTIFAEEKMRPDIVSRLGGTSRESCSILEMMVALAMRCESDIMTNPDFGDRTGVWFWEMVSSLGLGGMNDAHFDKEYVEDVIFHFLERDYAPDGRGGLFTVVGSKSDMATTEIWYQMQAYLIALRR